MGNLHREQFATSTELIRQTHELLGIVSISSETYRGNSLRQREHGRVVGTRDNDATLPASSDHLARPIWKMSPIRLFTHTGNQPSKTLLVVGGGMQCNRKRN